LITFYDLLIAVFLAMMFMTGCHAEVETADPNTDVAMGAAFVDLDYVDVYNEDGELETVVDSETDFHGQLSNGRYLMDFVSTTGDHSFLPDGRMAFAPMMFGGLPVDGPVRINGLDNPVWTVEVHPDLEANAHLTMRQREKDPKLLPWTHYFSTWGEEPNPEWDELLELGDIQPVAWGFGASGTYAGARLRVTWEASYATSGDYTNVTGYTCNDSALCWTSSSSPSGSYYAAWDGDSNGTGYMDSDLPAFAAAYAGYPRAGGYAVCADDPAGYATTGLTCGISVPGSPSTGTYQAKKYTCQGSTCTGGYSGTKPHGGECKFFNNLLLYRSGQYHSGTWHKLPSDPDIEAAGFAKESTATINAGDVLRAYIYMPPVGTKPAYHLVHSTLVVGYNSTTSTALTVDSNWVGTVGTTSNEYIGAHTMGFTAGSTSLSDLRNYYKLDCVYSGSGC
jgi:hypothetical protein